MSESNLKAFVGIDLQNYESSIMHQNNGRLNGNKNEKMKGEKQEYFLPFTMNKDLLANSEGFHFQSNVQMSNILLLRTSMRSD